jgi:hypothetical protein
MYATTANTWTWLGGSTLRGAAAGCSYGTAGVESAQNLIGSRYYPGVAENAGRIFVFGGYGYTGPTANGGAA